MKKETDINPPIWADKLFKLLCPPDLFEELQGDMQEQFELDLNRVGAKAAKRIYASETIKFAKPYFLKKRLLTLKRANSQTLKANSQKAKSQPLTAPKPPCSKTISP